MRCKLEQTWKIGLLQLYYRVTRGCREDTWCCL